MMPARKIKAMLKDQRVIPYNKEALRVVVPVIDEPAVQVKFYVLVGDNDGLCQTRKIQNSLIFYFAEFLSKATSVATRQSEWKTNARNAAVTIRSSTAFFHRFA